MPSISCDHPQTDDSVKSGWAQAALPQQGCFTTKWIVPRRVARTCFVRPRFLPRSQRKAADLKNRSALPCLIARDDTQVTCTVCRLISQVENVGWGRRAVFGMTAPLPADSGGRIHDDKMRRDVCATRAARSGDQYPGNVLVSQVQLVHNSMRKLWDVDQECPAYPRFEFRPRMAGLIAFS
jgi:hypothetical protein